MGISKTSDHNQIKIKMPNPSHEPPASSKAQNKDLKDMNILCTFTIKIEGQNFQYGCIKNPWPYPNQDQDAKPQSRSPSILKGPRNSTSTTQYVEFLLYWGLYSAWGAGVQPQMPLVLSMFGIKQCTTENNIYVSSCELLSRNFLEKTSDHIQIKSKINDKI